MMTTVNSAYLFFPFFLFCQKNRASLGDRTVSSTDFEGRLRRGTWFVETDDCVLPYGETNADELERAYDEVQRSGESDKQVVVLIDSERICIISKQRMFQLNEKTERERKIWRGYETVDEKLL
jgi:hypothetical protein